MKNGKSVLNKLMASILVNAVYVMQNFPVMLINTLIAPFALIAVMIAGAFYLLSYTETFA